MSLVQAHEGLLVFLTAILLTQLVPLHSWYHPNAFLQHLFANIGRRVYKKSLPKNQLLISGTLAFVMPILTILVLVFGIREFAQYPQWVDGLLLYLCLETSHPLRKVAKIERFLSLNQKATAKEVTSQLVVRDTANLSEMGICKACIETLCLNHIRQFWVIVLLYISFGPWLMLTYKMMLLTNHAWRERILPNSYFLKPISKTLYVLEYPFIRTLIALLSLFQNHKKTWHYIHHYGKHAYQKNSGWILSLFAASLNVQLGGPAHYLGEKLRKTRIGIERTPTVHDVSAARALIVQLKWFGVTLISLIWVLFTLALSL
ncbi:Adenosylcobinamide-phosphate synthase [Pseudoalteromonas luteoviolacea B = ATCC 29581]|nr:Adenosylcobinamide-phosphate synthase [Pseudoalteromonas luteoviolacea B = ATCC 29581]